MYGIKRDKMGRLTAPCNTGDIILRMTPGLDWVMGDRIAIATNTLDEMGSEDNFIETYDPATGNTILRDPLLDYHWGQADSTESQYGVDIRAEVVLLSRNIVIHGDDIMSWGGQIVTSDILDVNMTFRFGSTILDSVEIYNCS